MLQCYCSLIVSCFLVLREGCGEAKVANIVQTYEIG